MRLLVVEDEVGLADALQLGLTGAGFAVDVVHDGLEGLEQARGGGYDAIVLDLLLPGMNGYAVCRTLRAEGIWTPILVLTAKDGEYDEAEALDTGGDDFLAKPFSFMVLVSRLHALHRRGASTRVPVLEIGDLVIDPSSRQCQRNGTTIALSAREFDLLAALARQPGVVCSKVDLLKDVWGDGFSGEPNVVEVYVGYLRRKIDLPFGRRSLQTVRGEGYRMAPNA